jgi:hypothetical protein
VEDDFGRGGDPRRTVMSGRGGGGDDDDDDDDTVLSFVSVLQDLV